MATGKPDLTRIWAETAPASNVVDPDTTTSGKFSAGWLAEVPKFQHRNFIEKFITQALAYINEQGICEWDNLTTYPVGALVKGSNENVYFCLIENDNENPVTDTEGNWELFLNRGMAIFLDQRKQDLVSANDIADLDSLNNKSFIPAGNYTTEVPNIPAIGDVDVSKNATVSNSIYSGIIQQDKGVAWLHHNHLEEEFISTGNTPITSGNVPPAPRFEGQKQKEINVLAFWYQDFGLEATRAAGGGLGWTGWYYWAWLFHGAAGDGYEAFRHPWLGYYRGDDINVLDWQCYWLSEAGVTGVIPQTRGDGNSFNNIIANWTDPTNENHWMWQLFANTPNFKSLTYAMWAWSASATNDAPTQALIEGSFDEIIEIYKTYKNFNFIERNGGIYPVVFAFEGEFWRGAYDNFLGTTNTRAFLKAQAIKFQNEGWSGFAVIARNGTGELVGDPLLLEDGVIYLDGEYADSNYNPALNGGVDPAVTYEDLANGIDVKNTTSSSVNAFSVPNLATSRESHSAHPSTWTWTGSTPALFERMCRNLLTRMKAAGSPNIITIYNISEWAEGGPGLQPNMRDGKGYLDALRNALAGFSSIKTETELSVRKPAIDPIVFDMHFGPIKGVAWDGNGGTTVYVLSAAASQDDTSLTFTGTVPPDDTMLAVEAEDGTWYSVPLASAVGQVMSLREPLPVDLSASATVTNFYNDVAHPNANGYRVIMDDLIRNPKQGRRLINRLEPVEFGDNCTVTTVNVEDSYKPGSDNTDAYELITTTTGRGAFAQFIPNKGATYVVKVKINTQGNDVSFRIVEGENRFTTGIDVNKDTASYVEIPVSVGYDEGLPIKIIAYCPATVSTAVIISKFEVFEVTAGYSEALPEKATYGFIGDSWFDSGYDMVDRFKERFPAAQVINAGIGSQTSVDMSARFDSDIVSRKPDYVFICAGTNDLYAGNSVETFSHHIRKMVTSAIRNGIVPIVMTSSVGEQPGSVQDWFTLSRDYQEGAAYYSPLNTNFDLITFCVNAPVGTFRIASLGKRHDGFSILESWVSATNAINVKIGASPESLFTTVGTLSTGLTTKPKHFGYSGDFHAAIEITTTVAGVIQGYIKVSKEQYYD